MARGRRCATASGGGRRCPTRTPAPAGQERSARGPRVYGGEVGSMGGGAAWRVRKVLQAAGRLPKRVAMAGCRVAASLAPSPLVGEGWGEGRLTATCGVIAPM